MVFQNGKNRIWKISPISMSYFTPFPADWRTIWSSCFNQHKRREIESTIKTTYLRSVRQRKYSIYEQRLSNFDFRFWWNSFGVRAKMDESSLPFPFLFFSLLSRLPFCSHALSFLRLLFFFFIACNSILKGRTTEKPKFHRFRVTSGNYSRKLDRTLLKSYAR